MTDPITKGATFSPCRTWRYDLWRIWDADRPYLAVIGLNPSTADEERNDPTVTRCQRFARDWGYGGLDMLNLFALRSTDPRELLKAADPIGCGNPDMIYSIAQRAGRVLVAWGDWAGRIERRAAASYLETVVLADLPLYCLGINKSGEPKHPLYVRADTEPFIYKHPAS